MSNRTTASLLRSCYEIAINSPKTISWAPIAVRDCAMLADAMDIADSSARSHIECECRPIGGSAAEGWQWDTSTVEPDTAEYIAKDLRYLDARGLLIRQEGAPHVVSFREAEQ